LIQSRRADGGGPRGKLASGWCSQTSAQRGRTFTTMAAYWVTTYRAITNPDAMRAYAELAGPAIQAGGGRFLARGPAAKAYEGGLEQRVVLVEFPSVEQAIATHDSAAYQAALKALNGGADRDIRIVEGLP
jgi:uncharacterized protein (DUF1330 family)